MCDARTARDEDLVTIPVYFPPKDSGMRYATLTEGTLATCGWPQIPEARGPARVALCYTNLQVSQRTC